MAAHTGRDELWIIPSRSRPTRLLHMARQALSLAACRTDLAICTDTGDPAAAGYTHARARLDAEYPGRVLWASGPRDTLAGWTNRIATAPAITSGYAALGSMGDDHLPRPSRDGGLPWDAGLLSALTGGAAMAYGDDLHQGQQLATAWLARRHVTDALGWLILPAVSHYYGDNAVVDLGAVYVPSVVIEHCHPVWGTAPHDVTYTDAAGRYAADQAAYTAWRDGGGLAADRATITAALTQESAHA